MNAGRIRNRRDLIAFAVVVSTCLATLFIVASCGIALDESANAIPSSELDETLRPGQIPTPVPSGNAFPEELIEGLGLGRITFTEGSNVLTNEGRAELDKVAAFLVTTPVNVIIGGHTDTAPPLEPDNPDAASNAENAAVILTQDRADTVKAYLAERGVPPQTMIAFGFGSANPIVENDTEENRAINRRIEIRPTGPAVDIGPSREQIHMLQGNRLVTVSREFTDDPARLLEILLLDTFPAEAAQGIDSAINRGTTIQSVTVSELLNLATVDLGPGSLDPNDNAEQRLAFAQMVYTLTSLPDIDQVQFEMSDPREPGAEPVPLAVQTDTGTTPAGARVTRADFQRLDPSASPAFDLPVSTPTPVPDPNAEPTFELSLWLIAGTPKIDPKKPDFGTDDSRLVRTTRRLERTKEALLRELLAGPTAEEREQDPPLRSALPLDAIVKSISVETHGVTDSAGVTRQTEIAMVDLEPGSLGGFADFDEQFLSVAQIVFTLTQLAEIDQVAILIDGVPQPVSLDRENTLSLPFSPEDPQGLVRDDYREAFVAATAAPPTAVVPTSTPAPTPEAATAPAPTATPEPTPTPTPTAIATEDLPPTPIPTPTPDS